MYAPEPCVKYPCAKCHAWITAPQLATGLFCPQCCFRQSPRRDRMVHFSLSGRRILFGEDEWLEPDIAATRLDAERQRVEQVMTGKEWSRFRAASEVERVLTDQKAALDAALALCKRQGSL